MRSQLAAALCAVSLSLGCAHRGPQPAPATGVRLSVDVGERGEVTFLVPSGWKATSGEPDPPLPRSVRFEPPLGHVVLIVTPLWGPGETSEPAEPAVARVLVEAARDQARQGAVELEVPLLPLEAPGLHGWYFSVTDRELMETRRAAGPDDYRCLLQGAVVAGPLVIAFSLLDDGDGPHREPALGLLRGARHRPVEAQRPAERPSEPADRSHADSSSWGLRGAEPLELALPGRAWGLLLDLAGWNVAEPMRRLDGSGVTVIGRRQEDGLILTASLVEAGEQRGVEACRARDWDRIGTLDGVGEPRVEVTSVEARAWYTVSEKATPRGPPSRHLSSWRYREGACIHLHLSLQEDQPGVEGRLLRALGAVRYGEAL